MLIEILYGSQGSFSLEFGQTPKPRAARPHRASPSAEQLLKLFTIGFSFPFPAFTFFSLVLKSTLPFPALLSCDRKFSQLPTKVTVHCMRQQGPAWPSLNAQLRQDFVNRQQTKDAVPHLKVSAT